MHWNRWGSRVPTLFTALVLLHFARPVGRFEFPRGGAVFPHHTDGRLYECAILLLEEEESEEEKVEEITPPLTCGAQLPQ